MDEIRDFIAGFVCGRDRPRMLKPNFNFIRKEPDDYDSGLVTKDFIRKDILRYDQNWPVRRYWLNGDIRILNGVGSGYHRGPVSNQVFRQEPAKGK